MEKILLTQQGFEELKARYDYLCGEGRRQVSEKLEFARSLGDLSENAEYDAAKDEQAFMEKEIKDINERILHAEIIDESNLDNKTVKLGSTVKIQYLDDDEKEEYQILDGIEANIDANRISNNSPMGRALMGKKKGAEVLVDAPNGTIKVKVVSIR